MAAEAHAIPVADLRQDDPADLTPATGAHLATRLAEACADYGQKRHLGLSEVLGRDPTPDEAAIYAAAVKARDAALEALASWAPQSWKEFADKSEAIDLVQAAGCAPPGAGLQQLLADARRLGTMALPELAIPVWIRERERRRPPIETEDEAAHEARFDLFALVAGFILRAPCSSVDSGAAILRALLDPEIGLFDTDISFFSDDLGQNDQPALERVATFLEGRAPAGGGFSSRLAPSFLEALQLANQAEEAGYTDDGETSRGDALVDLASELLDGVHLAACTSRADALVKLNALHDDLDEVDDLNAVRDVVVASITSLRSWLQGLPSEIEPDGVVTRAEYRAARRAEAAAVPDPDPSAERELSRAADILEAYVRGDLIYRDKVLLDGTTA